MQIRKHPLDIRFCVSLLCFAIFSSITPAFSDNPLSPPVSLSSPIDLSSEEFPVFKVLGVRERVSLNAVYYENAYEGYGPIKLEADLKKPQEINLEEILAQAVESNLNLNIAKQDTKIQKWEFMDQASEMLPDIQYSLGGRDFDGTFFLNSAFQRDIDEKQAQSIFRINYRAFSGGTKTFLTWAEKYYKDAAKEDELLEFNRVLLSSIELYDRLVISQLGLLSRSKAVDEALSNLDLARKFQDNGLGTKYDILQAEARLSGAHQDFISEQANFRESEIELAKHLNMPLDTALKVDELTFDGLKVVDENIDVDSFMNAAYENNPRIKSALLKRKGAYKEALSKVGNFLPKLDLYMDMTATGQSISDLNNITTMGFLMSLDFGKGLGLGPFSEIMQYKEEAKKAKLLYEKEEQEIESELRKAFLSYEKAKSMIDAAKKQYEAATEGLRLARLRYQNGIGLMDEVIEQESELSSAYISMIKSIGAYNDSQAKLAFEMGSISVDNLLR